MSDSHVIREKKKERVRWWFGAATIALSLWAILSLSQTYSWEIDVLLQPRIDTSSVALAFPIPKTIRVTARADGWTLLGLELGSTPVCRIVPDENESDPQDSLRVYLFDEKELLNGIDVSPAIRLENARPGIVRVALTSLARKRVPLEYPETNLKTRDGFGVVGIIQLEPDSVWISGSAVEIERIDSWSTEVLREIDLFSSVESSVAVSDSLFGVVNVRPSRVKITGEIQEIAELELLNLPIVNKGASIDTNTSLILSPAFVSVLLRGGAEILGSLTSADVSVTVELIEGLDTSGYARPRISLPSRIKASVVRSQPERIRYFWRKRISGKEGILQ